MPFTLSQSVNNGLHRGLGLVRWLLKMRTDYFVQKQRQVGLALELAFNSDGCPSCCQLCGFGLAGLKFNDGWFMQRCSATGFTSIISCSGFIRWAEELVRLNSHKANPGVTYNVPDLLRDKNDSRTRHS